MTITGHWESFAGIRAVRKHRLLKNARVIVFDGREQGLEADGGRWYVECTAHATYITTDTLRNATEWAGADTRVWCGECSDM